MKLYVYVAAALGVRLEPGEISTRSAVASGFLHQEDGGSIHVSDKEHIVVSSEDGEKTASTVSNNSSDPAEVGDKYDDEKSGKFQVQSVVMRATTMPSMHGDEMVKQMGRFTLKLNEDQMVKVLKPEVPTDDGAFVEPTRKAEAEVSETAKRLKRKREQLKEDREQEEFQRTLDLVAEIEKQEQQQELDRRIAAHVEMQAQVTAKVYAMNPVNKQGEKHVVVLDKPAGGVFEESKHKPAGGVFEESKQNSEDSSQIDSKTTASEKTTASAKAWVASETEINRLAAPTVGGNYKFMDKMNALDLRSTVVSADGLNCFIISLLQHMTGSYDRDTFQRAHAVRNLVVKEFENKKDLNAMQLNGMLHSDDEVALFILQRLNQSSSFPVKIRKLSVFQVGSDGLPLICSGTEDESVDPNGKDVVQEVLLWQQFNHYTAITGPLDPKIYNVPRKFSDSDRKTVKLYGQTLFVEGQEYLGDSGVRAVNNVVGGTVVQLPDFVRFLTDFLDMEDGLGKTYSLQHFIKEVQYELGHLSAAVSSSSEYRVTPPAQNRVEICQMSLYDLAAKGVDTKELVQKTGVYGMLFRKVDATGATHWQAIRKTTGEIPLMWLIESFNRSLRPFYMEPSTQAQASASFLPFLETKEAAAMFLVFDPAVLPLDAQDQLAAAQNTDLGAAQYEQALIDVVGQEVLEAYGGAKQMAETYELLSITSEPFHDLWETTLSAFLSGEEFIADGGIMDDVYGFLVNASKGGWRGLRKANTPSTMEYCDTGEQVALKDLFEAATAKGNPYFMVYNPSGDLTSAVAAAIAS